MTSTKVLIVDDDPLYRKTIKKWVSNCGITQIKEANTAEKGSAEMVLMKPNIIFLDNELPKLNGSAIVSIYKKIFGEVKIVLMSSNFKVGDVARGSNNHADYILDKATITNDIIRQTIESITKEHEEQSIFSLLVSFFKGKPSKIKEKNICIVEDDNLWAFQVQWLLKQKKTHSISIFKDADSFYEYCKDNTPDIIFLDYFLPETNGEEVLKFINDNFKEAKTVMVSSQKNTQTAIDLHNMGIHGYIEKNDDWSKNLDKILLKLGVEA
ncbi:response regulator [Flavobacteriaceae bacterium]|nr:response regulator [Flavobacteriaceae bacterium]